MDLPLQKTLADVVRFLETNGVPFALVGGLAASFLGQPRITADVDLVIAADVARALELIRVLDTSKFRPLFRDVTDVVTATFMLPLRHRETGVKVDIAIGLSGFERQLVKRATNQSLDDCEIPVATAEDLLIMKSLAGRPQDEQDLQGIVMARKQRLDWEYCLQVAAELEAALDVDLVGRLRALRSNFAEGGRD